MWSLPGVETEDALRKLGELWKINTNKKQDHYSCGCFDHANRHRAHLTAVTDQRFQLLPENTDYSGLCGCNQVWALYQVQLEGHSWFIHSYKVWRDSWTHTGEKPISWVCANFMMLLLTAFDLFRHWRLLKNNVSSHIHEPIVYRLVS